FKVRNIDHLRRKRAVKSAKRRSWPQGRLPLFAIFLIVGGFASTELFGAVASKDPKTKAPPPSVSPLPLDLRPGGQAILTEKTDERRAKQAAGLAEEQPGRAERFLLAVCERDASPKVRAEILDALGTFPSPRVRRALERHSAGDPSVDVALVSLERL